MVKRGRVLKPGEAPGLYFSDIRKLSRDLELLIDILVPCPGTAASCSLNVLYFCCIFSLPSLFPMGSVFKRLDSCLHLLFNEGVVVLPSL